MSSRLSDALAAAAAHAPCCALLNAEARGFDEVARAAQLIKRREEVLRVRSCVSIRQHTPACVSIRQHVSAYVSIRQHTSAYLRVRDEPREELHHVR